MLSEVLADIRCTYIFQCLAHHECQGDGPTIGWISFTLRKHAYSNTLRILPPKNENFEMKNSDIFFLFLL